MSVTTYDSSVAFRQNQVARLGEKAGSRAPMTAEERKRFEASPFMQKMKEIDEKSWQKFSERDKKRRERDPNFKPADADFEAPKAHKYDKNINYYKVLGIEEYATNDEVKKAYRKLSLTYHPDKMSGKTQEEKDEASAIFMEVKSAYKTLSDEPTRRQYDFERDRDVVSASTNGKKPTEKVSFNAREAMQRIYEKAKENQKAPAEIVRVPVQLRLEKLVFGGHKALHRTRLVKNRDYGGFEERNKTFRIDIPAGAEQPWSIEFKRQGDQHDIRETDTLKFVFTAKPHAAVDRSGNDLRARHTVHLGDGFGRKPFIAAEVPSIAGRHVLLWGRNPFFLTDVSGDAEVRIRIVGEGTDRSGAFCVTLRMGLGPPVAPAVAAQASGRHSADGAQRAFLERFGLGPQWGFGAPAIEAKVEESTPLRAKAERRARERRLCEVELGAGSEPMALHTKPHSTVQLYGPASRQSDVQLFAVCLTSPPCAKQRAAADWDRFKARLVPVLQRTIFNLYSQPRRILPRRLAGRAAPFADRAALAQKAAPAVPWKRLGDEAARRGDLWEALWLYTRRVQELGLGVPRDAEEDATGDATEAIPDGEVLKGPDQVPETAKLLSNRAHCLARVGSPADALADARQAIRLAPRWARPYARAAAAAWHLGPDTRREALDSWAKAVELEPSSANVAALAEATGHEESPCADAAHAAKESGNEAFRGGQISLAVVRYTLGIARLPAPAASQDTAAKPDQHALLRGVLLCNRSGAFLRLRNFEAAVADAREAVAAQPALASVRCALGAALLGSNLQQEAYVEFAKGLAMEQDEHAKARKGRNACLQEMVLWRSSSAAARFNARFFLDLRRPRGTTRIFALSDVHFDHRENEDWVHDIDDSAFQDDVLIVAGNLGDSKVAIGRGLTTLRQKFRRVFYTVGNHEMSITHAEHARYPDSIAKFHAIIDECDEIGVDIFPAPICEGVTILPLFSWYSAEFDEQDPFPDPNAGRDKHCKWPMDADLQVWKYMAKLNEVFLAKPYYGTVISFSHFLPRRGLPFDKSRKNAAKMVGCDMLEDQIRAIGSKVHVYGHSKVKYAQMHAGVRYVNMPLGMEADWPKDHERRLMMIYDGKNLCNQDWGADGEPPLGFNKRVLHVAAFALPGLKEADSRKLKAAVNKLNAMQGAQVSFGGVGSAKREKDAFVKEIWPDMEALGGDITHVLVIVADDVKALKVVLTSDPYKRDFASLANSLCRNSCTISAPLGVDLRHEKRPDPVLLVFGLRCSQIVTEDSEEYSKLQKATEAINKLPGIEGKIAVGLQATGSGKLSQRELLTEAGVMEDKSLGTTHCFVVAVDMPESWKMLAASKTFAKWRATADASLSKLRGGPPLMAFAIPLEMTVAAAAPKKEKAKAVVSGLTGPAKR